MAGLESRAQGACGSMKIRLLRSAREDLLRGYEFYEAQNPGIGEYFLDSVSADIDSLLLYAGIHPRSWNGYHRMLTHRFPYAIYYRIAEEEIRIYAVLDCRENPRKHRNRLSSLSV